MRKQRIYEKYIKRLADIALSAAALVVLSPVLLVTAILVRVKLGSPVLFRQLRPGKEEKIFQMYKFRSMSEERDEKGNLLPDQERLNGFGRALRSTSLDELPELFCILKGDMSLVGPRPLAVKYLPYYKEEERMRHKVRPGLTGLAQINGRNTISWEERFSYDLSYVKNITALGDLKILWKTLRKVFGRESVTVRGEGTVQDFDAERRGQRISGI